MEESKREGALTPGRKGAAAAFLLPAVLVLLSRIPFLGPGYGLDPDAWRVAWAARRMAASGVYQASRAPGFPVHEILCAILSPGGPLALTLASALMAAVGAGFLGLGFRRLGSRDGLWAALALASAPAVYLASVQATDFVWGLAFALGALYFALSGRAWPAGVLAGLAIGCRVTSAAWLAPLAFALAHSRPAGHRRSAILACLAIAAAVGALAYLPPFLVSGTRFLHVYSGTPRALFVIKAATVELWGIPGTLGLVIAVPIGLLLARRPLDRASLAGAGSGLLLAGWALGLGLFWALFLLHPMKAAYLIPAVPLTLLLCGRLLERRAFLVLCAALIVSPWLLKVSQPGTPDSPAFTSGTHTLHVGRQTYLVDWLHGPIVFAHARTAGGVRYVEQSLARARRLEGESVVVAWEWLPQIKVRLGGQVDGRVRYVYLLSRDELSGLRARGISVYDLAGAEADNVAAYGIGLRESGSRALE